MVVVGICVSPFSLLLCIVCVGDCGCGCLLYLWGVCVWCRLLFVLLWLVSVCVLIWVGSQMVFRGLQGSYFFLEIFSYFFFYACYSLGNLKNPCKLFCNVMLTRTKMKFKLIFVLQIWNNISCIDFFNTFMQ